MPAVARTHRHIHRHDAAGFVGEVARACDERGLRLTPLRRRVLELVAAEEKPVKAYDLLDRVRTTPRSPMRRIRRSTVHLATTVPSRANCRQTLSAP